MTTIKYPYENNKVYTSLVGRVTKYNRESALNEIFTLSFTKKCNDIFRVNARIHFIFAKIKSFY